MNKFTFLLVFSLSAGISFSVFAQNDVCCIMAAVKGNNVSTFADFKTDAQCKKGSQTTTYTGAKNICTALTADSANCSDRGPEAKQKRCTLCGYQWVDGACVVEDLEKELKELKREKDKAPSK